MKSAAVFALISPMAKQSEASTIQSNWWFVVPKTVAATKAVQMKSTYKHVQQSLSVSGEIPTVFENVDADIGYDVTAFTPGAAGEWGLELNVPSLKFRAGTMRMNGVIERDVAGTKVRIHVNATCTGVDISAVRPFTMSLKGQIRNSPFGMNISSMTWNKDSSLWTVTTQKCDGPAGFTTFVNQQMNIYWQSSETFRQILLSETNKVVNDWAANRSMMNESFPEASATMTLKPVEFQEKGGLWVFRLESKINTTKKCVFAEVGAMKEITPPSTATTAQLLIPDQLVTKWSQCMHEMFHFKRTDDSSKTGLQTLMDSPGSQGFVWPDLQRYPATTKFDITTHSQGNWAMTPTTDPNALLYNVKTGIVSQFVHRSYRGLAPYVTFWGSFEGQVALSKVGENLTLKIQGTPTVSLKHRFDMVSKDITDKTIDTTRLRDEVVTAMKAEQMTFKIPTYEFSQAGVFQATGFSRSGGALIFPIDFTKSK